MGPRLGGGTVTDDSRQSCTAVTGTKMDANASGATEIKGSTTNYPTYSSPSPSLPPTLTFVLPVVRAVHLSVPARHGLDG